LLSERAALGCLALIAVVAIVWLALPFATGILLGTLLAFTLDPLYRLLVRRTKRPVAASAITVALSLLVLLGTLSTFVTQFVSRLVALADTLRSQLHSGNSVLNQTLALVTRWLSGLGITMDDLTSQLEAGAGEIATGSATIAKTLATGTFSVLLSLFFAVLTMHLVLRYWENMVAGFVVLSPLEPRHTRELLAEFRRVGRMTISGTVLTGLAQGLLAALGFWFTGVPQPIFFGFATALASLIPAVGTMLVWVPAGLYLLAIHHPVAGIIELAWGALCVVGLSDYLIRPRLVGDEAMPALMVFVALFGGLEVFGLPGLIVGPVLMALAVAVLRLYSAGRGSTGDAG
jgi:predicted PurR-regulated permease PerM